MTVKIIHDFNVRILYLALFVCKITKNIVFENARNVCIIHNIITE